MPKKRKTPKKRKRVPKLRTWESSYRLDVGDKIVILDSDRRRKPVTYMITNTKVFS